jgi:imidazolonepropionase-like amidohydrolase
MRSIALLAASVLALIPATAPRGQDATLKDVVLTLGKPSGEQTVTRRGSEYTATFSFNDRGRGPETTAHWTLDANGLPTRLEVTGKSYLKTPVDELFEADEKGHVKWHNEGEREERDAPGAFYAPMSAPPAFDATLVTAVQKAPGQKLPLLPAGTAQVERVGTRPVAMADGTKVTAVQYEVSGLDFTPSTVWLDEQGNFFATVSDWFGVVRAGAEGASNDLLAAQNERNNARAAALARQLAKRPQGALLVKNARVFDPRDGSVTPGTSVLVQGNRIAGIGPDGSLSLPAEVETIDAAGRFVMPGLWDNHVHIGGIDGLLHLAGGVTSVRDMANNEDELPARVARYDKFEELGPRVLMSGFMDGRGPFAGPTKVFVDDAKEAEHWVNWYADHGFVQIKVYSSLKPELVPVIARLAHARGLRLSGHVPAFMTAQQFVEQGADEIQHINMVFLNFLAKEVPDTRNMNRFQAIGQYAVGIKPDGERERAFIELLKKHHTTLDPTVNTFEAMYDGAADKIQPGYEDIVPRMPPQIARGFKGGQLDPPEGQAENYKVAYASMLRMLKGVYDAGIPIVPGTDSWSGFGLHRELELWSRAGIPNAAILRASTLGSAEVNRRAGERGVLAPGWLADLIIVDGDPLENISDIRKVRTTVKDGVVLDAAALYSAVGVKPAP